jgi:hypothetical protein
MGILDDAIKEHLELKRRHGAGESELKQLEDEAFGATERPGGEGPTPDPLAEAPTQFMSQPDLESKPDAESTPGSPQPAAEEAQSRPAPRAEIADLQEAPPTEPTESAADPEAPAEEEAPAMEHEEVPEAPGTPEPEPPSEPEIPSGPTTEERQAIAEQPTEMYDVEEELSASQAEAPSEEELVEEGLEEPRLAPVDPLVGVDAEAESAEAGEADTERLGEAEAEEEYEEDDDFWDEKRLSDELDQALEAPSEVAAEEEESTVFDPEPEPEPPAEPEAEQQQPSRPDEDVLEETPDFLEEAPEDDQLWFEQKPPKDFDFDD